MFKDKNEDGFLTFSGKVDMEHWLKIEVVLG